MSCMSSGNFDGKFGEYGARAVREVSRKRLHGVPGLNQSIETRLCALGPGQGLLFAEVFGKGSDAFRQVSVLHGNHELRIAEEKAIIDDNAYPSTTVTRSRVYANVGFPQSLSYTVVKPHGEIPPFLIELILAAYNPLGNIRITARRHGPGRHDLAVSFQETTVTKVALFTPEGILGSASEYSEGQPNGKSIPENRLPALASYYFGTARPRMNVLETIDNIIDKLTNPQPHKKPVTRPGDLLVYQKSNVA